jgi:hypothetical protein
VIVEEGLQLGQIHAAIINVVVGDHDAGRKPSGERTAGRLAATGDATTV